VLAQPQGPALPNDLARGFPFRTGTCEMRGLGETL
jgi:hypothetical protein